MSNLWPYLLPHTSLAQFVLIMSSLSQCMLHNNTILDVLVLLRANSPPPTSGAYNLTALYISASPC